MTIAPPSPTAVLISLRRRGEGDGGPRIMGRFLAERQAEYGAMAGCAKVILLGGGGGVEAIATRLRAEELGMVVQEFSGPHALAQGLPMEERLLVLQGDLLPATHNWLNHGSGDGRIAILPAAAGADAGFERIDLARAWAGALVLPGQLLHSLLDLPEDSEAAPALLRIALQARLPETKLPEVRLVDGAWSRLGSNVDAKLVEDKWLALHRGNEGAWPVTRRLTNWFLRRFGARLLDKAALMPALTLLALALTAGAVTAAWYDFGAAAFALIALASLVMEMMLGLRALRALPMAENGHWSRLVLLIDLAMVACGIMLVDGRWLRQIFAPLVLLAAFHSAPAGERGWRSAWRDRSLVAALVAAVSTFAMPEAGMMLAGLLLLALNLAGKLTKRS